MGTKAAGAILDPCFGIRKTAAAPICKCIQWTVTKQAAKGLRVSSGMAGKILTFPVLKKIIVCHFFCSPLFCDEIVCYNLPEVKLLKVLIDADACPVTDIAVNLCIRFHTECLLLCDTAHALYCDGASTLVFDKGADSVDFALANRVCPGDIVITQDYGLAAMCLAKNAAVLHQDGWAYTRDNIDALLFQRHASRECRAAGGRTKGPAKRKRQQDLAFADALENLLQQSVQG